MQNKHPLPIHNVRIKKLKSLLAIVENSVKGDNYLFRNLYADENGKEVDILENGSNSCAAFVSWILLALELIKHPHATVFGTEKDLLSSGWHEIQKPKSGAVIVWGKTSGEVLGEKIEMLSHVGFYVGNDEAVSNGSEKTGFPWKHHYTYNNTRKIEKIYWHDEFEPVGPVAKRLKR